MKDILYNNFSKFLSKTKIQIHKKNSNLILLFHSICDDSQKNNDLYDMCESDFEKIIIYLHNNFEFETFLNCRNLGGKVIITFDDGFKNILTNANPILQKYNIPYHIFVVSDFINLNNETYLNEVDLKKLSTFDNVSIGSHGKTHNKLTKFDQIDLDNDLIKSKDFIEQIIGKEVKTISFPHGAYNKRVLRSVISNKYDMSASSVFGCVNANTNKHILPRLDIWANDSTQIVKEKIMGYWNWINIINAIKKINGI